MLSTRDISLAVDPASYDDETNNAYVYQPVAFVPSKTVLVIIDPWASHANDGWLNRAGLNMQTHLAPLISHARTLGIRIVYAPTNQPISPLVAPQSGDTVISTPGSNTDNTALDGLLVQWGVDTILYAGYASNLCIIDKPAGVRRMYETRAGRRHIVVRDASIGFEMPWSLETEAMHNAAIFQIEYFWGMSTTVAEVAALLPPSPAPAVVLNLPGNNLTDTSGSAHPVSAVGNATVDAGSFLFDGVSDRLAIPDHANWHFGSGDFTIEFEGYALTSGDPGSIIIGQADSAGAGSPSWLVFRNSTHLGFYANSAAGSFNVCAVNAAFDTSPAQWRACRVEKRAGVLSLKVDGAVVATGPCGAIPDIARPLTIGGAFLESNDTAGRLRNIKITKGA